MKHVHHEAKANPNDVATASTSASRAVTESIAKVPGLVDLTARDRAHLLKPRTGAEKYVRHMAQLAGENAKIRPMNVDPAAMLERLAIVEELQPLRAALEAALQRVEDTILFAQCTACHDALDVLAVARGPARQDHALGVQIAPFDDFLRTGPHHAQQASPPAAS